MESLQDQAFGPLESAEHDELPLPGRHTPPSKRWWVSSAVKVVAGSHQGLSHRAFMMRKLPGSIAFVITFRWWSLYYCLF